MKFYPYEKEGGGGKSFSHARRWAQKVEVKFFCGNLTFKPYLRGGGPTKSFHPLKREREKFYPVLRAGRKKFRTGDFVPPLPLIDDQSLR